MLVITSAPEEEIVKQVKAVKKKYGLSDADLKQRMGGSIEDLKEELRKGWIISQFIEKAVLKGINKTANLSSHSGLQKQRQRLRLRPMKN